ncbi:peroxiredoxin [Candidatus Pantoea edessiphila]|uniref:Alkyl hydroperoxide reductase C n=1 Tax=Candidatus Pantoea edessiphila TaxID=2044610 RepID=A0A2P5SYN2_9GAMM|nr:alkyl hydroperoxide reductase subunit C [Candidatus Pantoea edessiphila]MBK4775461.1 peroxiredoxin [Pantoea sp. Edef]PPI87412.1 peroxiredoxin [Candidatus Pantoea edessiphila]
MSLINTKVKPFKNTAFKNNKFIEVTEKDLEGKWNIFIFYPADFTFVCPTELNDIAQQYIELQRLGVEVYSVSTDTHFSHKAWHDLSDTITNIKYAMIGDPTGRLTRNFDMMQENKGLANRGTFIIDPESIIQSIEINSDGIGRNSYELLRKIQAAQYIYNNPGKVCPARWQSGDAALTLSINLVGKI